MPVTNRKAINWVTLAASTVIRVRSANVTVLIMIRRRCPNRSDNGDSTR
jgi:hypothetical protein